MENEKVISIGKEFTKAKLGDARLSRRLEKLGESLSHKPSESFPKAVGTVGELEATYRFLRNPKITPEKILESHFCASVERSENEERVLVIHDSTEFLFSGEARREEIGSTKQNNLGFLGHFSLAVCRSNFVHRLGIVGMATFFGAGKDNKQRDERWWDLAHEVRHRFPVEVNPISPHNGNCVEGGERRKM